MFVTHSLGDALALIGAPEVIHQEIAVPARQAGAGQCPYLPEYDWLFVVERRIARILEPWLFSRRQELIGPGGVLSEALSNAYCHGHRRDASLPMEVKVYCGHRGLLVRIQDSGAGFDPADRIAKLESGRRYFQVAGSGLRSMRASDGFDFFYTDQGTAFHLLYRFPAEDVVDLASHRTGPPRQ